MRTAGLLRSWLCDRPGALPSAGPKLHAPKPVAVKTACLYCSSQVTSLVPRSAASDERSREVSVAEHAGSARRVPHGHHAQAERGRVDRCSVWHTVYGHRGVVVDQGPQRASRRHQPGGQRAFLKRGEGFPSRDRKRPRDRKRRGPLLALLRFWRARWGLKLNRLYCAAEPLVGPMRAGGG